MESEWFLSKHLLKTICGALPLRNVDLDLCGINTIADLDELFVEVEHWEVLEGIVRVLHYNR